MTAQIYAAQVRHTRYYPVRHDFQYPVYTYGFDLEALEKTARRLPFFSYNRFNLSALYDRDYLGHTGGTIQEKIRRLLEEQGVTTKAIHSFFLITSARYLNYAFNPVSFYFALDMERRPLAVVAEVNNTFGEKHLYVLKELKPGRGAFQSRAIATKSFHVSPFNDLEGEYHFFFGDLNKGLNIQINLKREGRIILHTEIKGTARPLTTANHLGILLRFPLSALLTIPSISREAAKLYFLKKLPLYHKPYPQSPMTIIKAPADRLERLCRTILFSLLKKIKKGQLTVVEPDGQKRVFGNPDSTPRAKIRICDYRFFPQVVFHGDIGFGDAYIEKLWDSPELTSLLTLFVENDNLNDGNLLYSLLSRFFLKLRHRRCKNTVSQSKKNIESHYDLGNRFYQLFLDSTMTYSAGIFKTAQDSLEQAQYQKIEHLMEKLELRETDHLLEIGCGWGSFLKTSIETSGCRGTGVTLSNEQFAYCQTLREQLGLQEKMDVQIRDYRHLDGQYEKIVSIEMIEAVGHDYLPGFFQKCESLLKKGGKMAIQVITIADERYENYRNSCDWIQKHIFPGGHLPSISLLNDVIKNHTGLVVKELQSIGLDYATTLVKWRDNFLQKKEELLKLGYDPEFQRKWLYYFHYCEAGFLKQVIDNYQILLEKPE